MILSLQAQLSMKLPQSYGRGFCLLRFAGSETPLKRKYIRLHLKIAPIAFREWG